MEKNFNDMTMEELKKLQELLSTEIHKREEKEKIDAKEEIYLLLNEIAKICDKYNFSLYDYYNGEIFISDVTVGG